MLHAVQCFSFFQKPQEVKASKHEFLKKKNTEADQNINQKQYFFCNMAARMQIDLVLYQPAMKCLFPPQHFGNSPLIHNIKLNNY